MTANLSFAMTNPMTRKIETFYTALHSAMYDLGDITNAPFPTAREFHDYLGSLYPQGMAGLACLDAGCGATGVCSCSLVQRGADDVTAVDINENSLQLVSSAFAARGMQQVRFRHASVLDLPFPDASFDFIVSSGVVHVTPDPAQAVREAARVARKGARLYISAYCFEGSWMHLAVRLWRALAWVVPFRVAHFLCKRSVTLNNFVLDHMYVPILWIYRAADFHQLLEQNGFTVRKSFPSKMDTLMGRRFLGKTASGDGLMRVYDCTRSD